MWQACEPAIGRKIAASYDVRVNDIRRCVAFVNTLPPPSAPESPFFLTLGTPAQQQCPPLNSTLAQRTKEEGARILCENKAVAIIQRMQEGKPALIPKECEEILIAIVLDRPLKEAQRLVENPERFFNEILWKYPVFLAGERGKLLALCIFGWTSCRGAIIWNS